MRISGNTILITGGTSGIGRALAEQLHACGNRVIITGRRKRLLDEITGAHPGMQSIEADLQDVHHVEALAKAVQDRHPELNVLVNNAGISRQEELGTDPWDFSVAESIIRTNVLSVIQLTALLLPTLRRAPNAAIITTSSGLAFVPRANFPTYCASKAFIHSWIQSLRVQLKLTGIEILELIPPYVQTELAGPEQANDPAAMPLAEYVAEVMRVLEADWLIDGEILVRRVDVLRWAERNGNYPRMFAALNGL
jgi:uncharacterized oxidoreductase